MTNQMKKCSNNKRTVRILCKLTTNDGIWFFSVAAWKKSFTVREREHRNESVPLSCCPIISDFTIAIGVGAYTIYSALKREKTVIIIIMMIMLHLNFFHAHLKNRHSFLLIALHCSEQRFCDSKETIFHHLFLSACLLDGCYFEFNAHCTQHV